jgi:hypothetical protein
MLHRRQPARLCLYGPPGAGKTAYASELAKRLDRPFNLVSGSDLQSCFVGETEKNIAGMFTEAERTGAVLLLDEADTFLFSRDTAYRPWGKSRLCSWVRWVSGGSGFIPDQPAPPIDSFSQFYRVLPVFCERRQYRISRCVFSRYCVAIREND